MKRDELFIKPPREVKEDVILFAGTDFTHFNDECFIITDGVKSLPHANQAAKLTAETAVWAYKVVRQRPNYWRLKLDLLKRIFRSTNLTLWQKRRDPGYEDGLACALLVVVVIKNYFWAGSAGNCNSFLYREGLIDILTKRDVDDEGMITKAVGFGRKQLIPNMRSEKLLYDDVILMATDSMVNFVSEDEMRTALETIGTTQDSLASASEKLVDIAKANGSTGAISVCLVKRVAGNVVS